MGIFGVGGWQVLIKVPHSVLLGHIDGGSVVLDLINFWRCDDNKEVEGVK